MEITFCRVIHDEIEKGKKTEAVSKQITAITKSMSSKMVVSGDNFKMRILRMVRFHMVKKTQPHLLVQFNFRTLKEKITIPWNVPFTIVLTCWQHDAAEFSKKWPTVKLSRFSIRTGQFSNVCVPYRWNILFGLKGYLM